MPNNNLTIQSIINAFRENGLYISPSWIRRQEDKGNLILPRSTTNFKKAQGSRKLGAVRYITEKQIYDILKCFLPEGTMLTNGEISNGRGFYDYKYYEEDKRNN